MNAQAPATHHVEIRHFHLFCGLGGGARGFNRGSARVGSMRAHFRCIGGVDVDAGAIADFERLSGAPGTVMDLASRDQYVGIHGHEPPDDWREVTTTDIQRAAGWECPHIVFLSAPCLPADGLVLTEHGPRAISTIAPGDRVLTHRGRLRAVSHVGSREYQGTMYGIRLNGTVDVQWFTDNHPLWVRRVIRNKVTGRKRALGEPEFLDASAVRVGDRIGFPVGRGRVGTARAFIEGFGNPRLIEKGGKKSGRYRKSAHIADIARIVDLRPKATSRDVWFLLGAYLGDGYRRRDGANTINFCVGPENCALSQRVSGCLDRLGLAHHVDRSRGPANVKIRVNSRHLHMVCGAFGDGADGKRIPPELMEIETPLLRALVEGYRATDGSSQSRRNMPKGNVLQARWKIASISLQLLRDMQRLLLREGIFASIHKCWPGGSQVIEGRDVNTRERWELNVRLDPVKRTVFEFDRDTVWVRVRTVETRTTRERVWNLSVDDDDTFCAPMMATHNCKGFSGLLSEARSRSDKYQALNHLTVRGVLLMLEAWRDDPPEMVLFENVPRIANRGRPLLDTIVGLLQAYGYAVAETTHDCGELGGLAQSRKRFLLVARHIEKVPPFLYEPRTKPLRGVGEVIGRLPLPVGDPINPMHRLPSLQWRTWVRLAFVEAGKDWRSLQRLAVEDGFLRDYRLAPAADWNGGVLGVRNWDQPSATVTGRSAPTTGSYAVADPRIDGHPASVQHGVKRWDQTAGVVTGKMFIGGGPHSVADPRIEGTRHNTTFRVVRWPDAAPAVTGPGGPGGLSVADPRSAQGWAKYPMTEWEGPAGSVIGASTTGQGAFAVADPRPAVDPSRRSAYLTSGHYGVVPWDSPSGGVTGSLQHDSGRGNVADPRLPEASDQLQCMIIAEDNTWHRPFTTLELAALQSLLDLDEYEHFELHGRSDSSYRERIGNAVPSDAAAAIASEMGRTLLLAWSGETFILDSSPIWVRPIVAAIQCGRSA